MKTLILALVPLSYLMAGMYSTYLAATLCKAWKANKRLLGLLVVVSLIMFQSAHVHFEWVLRGKAVNMSLWWWLSLSAHFFTLGVACIWVRHSYIKTKK